MSFEYKLNIKNGTSTKWINSTFKNPINRGDHIKQGADSFIVKEIFHNEKKITQIFCEIIQREK